MLFSAADVGSTVIRTNEAKRLPLHDCCAPAIRNVGQVLLSQLHKRTSCSRAISIGWRISYMLDGIDWRNPIYTFRPERAG
jgi:hypothetical protein